MTRKDIIRVPQFLFHFPHSGKLITYHQLEERARRDKNIPPMVGVKEIVTPPRSGKILGSFPVGVALKKFK